MSQRRMVPSRLALSKRLPSLSSSTISATKSGPITGCVSSNYSPNNSNPPPSALRCLAATGVPPPTDSTLAHTSRPHIAKSTRFLPAANTRIVAQIRQRWPKGRILLRADSGFARDALMTWCENNGIDSLFGLAKNACLNAEIETELAAAQE